MRGGHPEQREPGGGWGAPPAPTPAHGTPRVPRPRAAGAAGVSGFGQPGGTARGTVGGPVGFGTPLGTPHTPPPGGPRREYLDAFSDDDVFLAGAPGARGGDGLPPGGRFTGRSVVFDRDEIDELDRRDGLGADGAGPHGPADPSYEDADTYGDAYADGAEPDDTKGAKGRTFTGAAAAAVTTVLAVVIAGQVADQHNEGEAAQARSGPDRADGTDDQASRSHPRPTPDAKPATYDQKMAQVFPLDAKLTGSGRFKATGGDARAPGRGKVLRYRVDVEEGLPLDGTLFADAVHKTLNDDRSWAHGGVRTFQRVGSGDADFVITLASPGTTAKWCAKSGLDTTEDNVSCDSAATERVMINAYRWAQGAKTYGDDKMHAYRQMLINHEVGHRLGHDHEACSRPGALAPVMMQQTKFLTTDGATCRPNSWPFPTER
ncbi:DUF3152 domain-containing protein [Streptomyces piniterrae]|uniref:DUF3152 domain-containing protein n=1 Tax=Streptomyces piniterrae TaxID=2571125 RepID=A0A4U0MWD5_9ACTN|nr:DUF3152 domain-containing protein [Streptomyces piniterrae]TJZ45419.1 DUF3152 domain-containing protein [Streptomyces piniterrae]